MFSAAEPPDYEKEDYLFPLLPGEYVDGVVIEGGAVYFVGGNFTAADVVVNAAITKRENNTTEILYTEEREDGGRLEVYGLNLAGNQLFWVYSDFEKTAIRAYDLLEKEVRTIAAYPREDVFLSELEADDRFLTWYESTQDGNASLYVFDTEDQKVQCLSDHIDCDHSFLRAYVQDGVTSYIENDGEAGNQLTVYDLEGDQELNRYRLPGGLEKAVVQANREYVIIREGYEQTGLYLLDEKENELQELDYSVHTGVNPFSWHLMGNRVLINSRGEGGRPDELVILSLEDSTLSWIPFDHTAVFGKVREPNQYSVRYASGADEAHRAETVEVFWFDE